LKEVASRGVVVLLIRCLGICVVQKRLLFSVATLFASKSFQRSKVTYVRSKKMVFFLQGQAFPGNGDADCFY
jgi:hypothetical protein